MKLLIALLVLVAGAAIILAGVVWAFSKMPFHRYDADKPPTRIE